MCTPTAERPEIHSMYTTSAPSRTASCTFSCVASYRSSRQGIAICRSASPRGERRDLPQPQPHVVDAVRVPLQRAPLRQRAHEAVHGAEREPGAAADVGQAERRVGVVEGGEYGEQPVGC
jgi:hypothetical protein